MSHGTFRDFELARSVYQALQGLRSRKTSATVLELDAIAAQAAIPPNWQRRDNRSYVDEARTDAWLAVCRLVAATTENQNAVNQDEPTKVIDVGPLWSVALDRAQAWIEDAE
jgi:hypothetical protein